MSSINYNHLQEPLELIINRRELSPYETYLPRSSLQDVRKRKVTWNYGSSKRNASKQSSVINLI